MSAMMYKFIIVLVMVLVCRTGTTKVDECIEDGVPLPAYADINDCENMPCQFKQGSSVQLNVTFKSGVYTDVVRPEVIAYALGAEVNYPLNEPDGCKSLINTYCPLEINEGVIYQLNMPITILYPQISLTIKLTLYDENNKGMVCISVKAQVVS